MSRIELDPEELRIAAQMLDILAENMKQHESRVQIDVETISETWGDERFAEFQQRWELTRGYLARFYPKSERFSDFLRAKAKAVEEYLGG